MSKTDQDIKSSGSTLKEHYNKLKEYDKKFKTSFSDDNNLQTFKEDSEFYINSLNNTKPNLSKDSLLTKAVQKKFQSKK